MCPMPINRLSIFARQPHYVDHLAPVWNALPHERRGIFYVGASAFEYALPKVGPKKMQLSEGLSFPKNSIVLACAYGDMSRAAQNGARKVINMEHGTGHTFGTAAYPNGKGKRDMVDLFLYPNEYTARKALQVRSTRYEVIGTPKMDEWIPQPTHRKPADPVIAIAFHWGERNATPPESGTAWEHYEGCLADLARYYRVIGHGHPLAAEKYEKEFRSRGIEWVDNFADVMRRADIYVNDLSSTLYEFLVTGKPVIVLNAPWFRRTVHHGIRFWDYSEVGVNVEGPEHLSRAIDATIQGYEMVRLRERFQAMHDLYPYLGKSAMVAARVIVDYLKELDG